MIRTESSSDLRSVCGTPLRTVPGVCVCVCMHTIAGCREFCKLSVSCKVNILPCKSDLYEQLNSKLKVQSVFVYTPEALLTLTTSHLQECKTHTQTNAQLCYLTQRGRPSSPDTP